MAFDESTILTSSRHQYIYMEEEKSDPVNMELGSPKDIVPNKGTSKIIAIDPDGEAYEFGLPFIRKAGVEHKISFIQSDAFSALNEMSSNGEGAEMFDFVFVDADKPNYINYHEQAIKLVKVGGVIAYDNTLYRELVVTPENEVPEQFRGNRKAIMDVNILLASDCRVEISLIPIGDGLTLCRRIA
ncbi:unnamed protein product [Ilex paraguariensis]|uniref:Caffeoyl-CoA O-methyltransferase n=1 Tax=Ilex paraguariensis TaxID=185542 RepID=A0ABC8UAQ6_9AQUA